MYIYRRILFLPLMFVVGTGKEQDKSSIFNVTQKSAFYTKVLSLSLVEFAFNFLESHTFQRSAIFVFLIANCNTHVQYVTHHPTAWSFLLRILIIRLNLKGGVMGL